MWDEWNNWNIYVDTDIDCDGKGLKMMIKNIDSVCEYELIRVGL